MYLDNDKQPHKELNLKLGGVIHLILDGTLKVQMKVGEACSLNSSTMELGMGSTAKKEVSSAAKAEVAAGVVDNAGFTPVETASISEKDAQANVKNALADEQRINEVTHEFNAYFEKVNARNEQYIRDFRENGESLLRIDANEVSAIGEIAKRSLAPRILEGSWQGQHVFLKSGSNSPQEAKTLNFLNKAGSGQKALGYTQLPKIEGVTNGGTYAVYPFEKGGFISKSSRE
jgi:hypothetical protein